MRTNKDDNQAPAVKEPPFNIFTAKPIWIKSHDLVLGCIYHNRRFRKPLKAVYLKPKLYEEFVRAARNMLGKAYVDGQPFMIDGVNIELGSKFQAENTLEEFYPENQNTL